MKTIYSILFFLTMMVSVAQETTRTVDYSKSSVSFVIRNAGLNVDGSFKEYNAVVVFNPSSLSTTRIEGKIKTASIATGVKARDNHLRKADFFDAEKYPEIHFKTTGIKAQSSGYLLIGKLTIKDVTKEVSLPLTITKDAAGEVFEAKLTIDRREYHVGEDSWVMGDEVAITVRVVTK